MAGSGDSGRSVLSWTISDVRAWLTELGMARYAKVFCDQHRVDGPALLMIQVSVHGYRVQQRVSLSGN